MSKKQDTTPAQRFWAKVDSSGGPDACWPWTAHTCSTSGYGIARYAGVSTRKAHRLALGLSLGYPIPRRLLVRHTCHSRPCCNPDHLVLGTHRDNMRDMREAGRASGLSVVDDDIKPILDAAAAGVSCQRIADAFGLGKSTVMSLTAWYLRFEALGLTRRTD